MTAQATPLEIKKANLRAARLAAGITDEMAKFPLKCVQKPDGIRESDYRYRKFSRHHLLVA